MTDKQHIGVVPIGDLNYGIQFTFTSSSRLFRANYSIVQNPMGEFVQAHYEGPNFVCYGPRISVKGNDYSKGNAIDQAVASLDVIMLNERKQKEKLDFPQRL